MYFKTNFLKKLYPIFLIVLFTISSAFIYKTTGLYEDNILGTYLTPNKKSKIEFIKRDSLYFGILIWNVNPEIKDKFNSNKSLRNTNLIGQDIFKNLKYNKYERSWFGKFYDTESGTTYDCKLWLENNKRNLMARGYIETPILGRTEILRRLE